MKNSVVLTMTIAFAIPLPGWLLRASAQESADKSAADAAASDAQAQPAADQRENGDGSGGGEELPGNVRFTRATNEIKINGHEFVPMEDMSHKIITNGGPLLVIAKIGGATTFVTEKRSRARGQNMFTGHIRPVEPEFQRSFGDPGRIHPGEDTGPLNYGTPISTAFRLMIDGKEVDSSVHEFHNNGSEARDVVLTTIGALGRGEHSVEVQWRHVYNDLPVNQRLWGESWASRHGSSRTILSVELAAQHVSDLQQDLSVVVENTGRALAAIENENKSLGNMEQSGDQALAKALDDMAELRQELLQARTATSAFNKAEFLKALREDRQFLRDVSVLVASESAITQPDNEE